MLKKSLLILCCLLCFCGCQPTFKLDKKIIPEYVKNGMEMVPGYRIDEVYYYQGNHLRINDENIGKGMAIKVKISNLDLSKDSKSHELVYVLNEDGEDLADQGLIIQENPDVLYGVDKIVVFDSNREINYRIALNKSEIKVINQQIRSVVIK